MRRKERLKIAGAMVLAVCILLAWVYALIGGCVYQASVHAVNQEKRPLAIKRENLKAGGFDVDAFEKKYQARPVRIQSSFGNYKIVGNYLTSGSENNHTVVMAHGLNGSRYTGYPVARMFLKQGYNVLTYDQRDSGRSQVQCMTCGYWESRDFQDCVQYVRQRVDATKKVGGWGSSIGGATVGIYLGTDHAAFNLDFAILDCPVSSMRDIIGILVKDKAAFLPLDLKLVAGDNINRLNLGFSYEDGNACRYVEHTKVPALIFNSKADRVTPYYMGVDLYKAMKDNDKEIFTVKGSKHTDIYLDYPGQYEKTMIEFINKNVI